MKAQKDFFSNDTNYLQAETNLNSTERLLNSAERFLRFMDLQEAKEKKKQAAPSFVSRVQEARDKKKKKQTAAASCLTFIDAKGSVGKHVVTNINSKCLGCTRRARGENSKGFPRLWCCKACQQHHCGPGAPQFRHGEHCKEGKMSFTAWNKACKWAEEADTDPMIEHACSV